MKTTSAISNAPSSNVSLSTPVPKFLSVRGISTLDVSFPSVMSTFFDVPRSLEWVQDLKEVKETNYNKRTRAATLRQRYRVAGGVVVRDREFVLERTVKVDKRGRAVTVEYRSKGGREDKDLCTGCVRAKTGLTRWVFKSLKDGRTGVDLEAEVDPGGNLGRVMVDLIQRKWPRNSILGLGKASLMDLCMYVFGMAVTWKNISLSPLYYST